MNRRPLGLALLIGLAVPTVAGAHCNFQTPFVRPWLKCTSPTTSHTPDGFSACTPPALLLMFTPATCSCHAMSQITGLQLKSCASLTYKKNPPAGPNGNVPPNVQDIAITASIWDVKCDGMPYNSVDHPGLDFKLVVPIRVTDEHCAASPCTVVDTDIVVPLDCVAGHCTAGGGGATTYRGIDQLLNADLIRELAEVEYGQMKVIDPIGNVCLIQGQNIYGPGY
jgi:hypothetical protein